MRKIFDLRSQTRVHFLVGVILLIASVIQTHGAFCAQPPSWPPPEEEWRPMSPEEARPEMRLISIYYGVKYLEPGEPFFLYYGWGFVPSNVAYDLETGEQVTTYWNLQDRTDWAYCKFSLTINGQSYEPTGQFTGTCNWYRFYDGMNDRWVVVPKWILFTYWVEFPQGLSEGTYETFLTGEIVDGGEFMSFTASLHVE